MQSTFHGLETARRAMMAQQSSLRTVGHNIANANTKGYSRQRVNLTQTEPFPGAGMNRPRLPGHLGTGVKADSIQRIREHFLDVQYRNETNKVGYWETRMKAFEQMEDVLIETEDQGLNYQIDLFWTSLQDLILDPEDSGARSVVRERGKFIAETFNHYHNSLTEIKNDYKTEIEETQKKINVILNSIDEINDQIRRTEPHGYVPNDLYDKQDLLLDELAEYVNIKVSRESTGGNRKDVAEGPVTVTLVQDLGDPYVDNDGNPIRLIDGLGEQDHLHMSVVFDDDGFVKEYHFLTDDDFDAGNNSAINFNLDEMPRGEMKSLIEAYGYGSDIADVVGIYPDMINELNVIAETFVEEFNNIHKLGYTLADADGNIKQGEDFFTIDSGADAAKSIKVSDNILESLNHIAASGVNVDALTDNARENYETLLEDRDYDGLHALLQDDSNFIDGVPKAFAGDASNARLLANMKDTILDFDGDSGTIGTYYQGVIGNMAVETQEAIGMLDSSYSIRDTVQFNRESVSSVSLDEEITMLIQFQHAYNAAARNITSIDEMLDRIINGMGIVGR